MLRQRRILAQSESLGNLTRCPHGCFHLQLGRMSVALSEEEYVELVAMINQSAANYELLREGWFRDSVAPDSRGENLDGGFEFGSGGENAASGG